MTSPAASGKGPFSSVPLIFQASRWSARSPYVLYTSNRGWGVGDPAGGQVAGEPAAGGPTAVGLSSGGRAAAEPADSFNLSYKVGDDPAAVTVRQRRLRQLLGRPLAVIRQVHSATVVDLDDYLATQPAGQPSGQSSQSLDQSLAALAAVEADALVSRRTDIALGIYTADCTPVLLADSVHGVYAAAHAGRRGVENGVVPATVTAMAAKGAGLAAIEVWLGPNICGTCYETGSELAGGFARSLSDGLPGLDLATAADRFTTRTRFGGLGIDMRAALLAQLAQVGIKPGQVHERDQAVSEQVCRALVADTGGPATPVAAVAQPGRPPQAAVPASPARLAPAQPLNPLCTLENPLFYSYREHTLTGRPGSNGRFLSILLP